MRILIGLFFTALATVAAEVSLRAPDMPEFEQSSVISALKLGGPATVDRKMVWRGSLAEKVQRNMERSVWKDEGKEEIERVFYLSKVREIDPRMGYDSTTKEVRYSGRLEIESFPYMESDSFWRAQGNANYMHDMVMNIQSYLEAKHTCGVPKFWMRESLEIQLPPEKWHQYSAEYVISRKGMQFRGKHVWRGNQLSLAWDWKQDSVLMDTSWSGSIDSIARISWWMVQMDHRSWWMRNVQEYTQKWLQFYGNIQSIPSRMESYLLMPIFLVLVFSILPVWLLLRRNPKQQNVYGSERIPAPSWWKLYPATLVILGLWLGWGILTTGSVLEESTLDDFIRDAIAGRENWAIAAFREAFFLAAFFVRIYMLIKVAVLFVLFQKRRNIFPFANASNLIAWGLWSIIEVGVRQYLWDKWNLLPAVPFSVVLAVACVAWGIYLRVSPLAGSVFSVPYVGVIPPDRKDDDNGGNAEWRPLV